jgi:stress response protein YsnF
MMSLHRIKDFDSNDHEQSSNGDVRGFDLYSKDEKVGSVNDLLVDDDGHFRYLVINTGIWIVGKEVLLPIGRSQIDYNTRRVYAVNFTKAQAESLLEFTGNTTVDFDYEDRVRQVYCPSLSSVPAASAIGYAGYGTAPSVPADAPPSHGIGYEGYETAPLAPADAPASFGIGYTGYEAAPPVPADAPPSYGVGHEGYEADSSTPGRILSPDVDTGATVDRRESYIYQQDPSLYEMNDQSHKQLKLYEERLVANIKRHDSKSLL